MSQIPEHEGLVILHPYRVTSTDAPMHIVPACLTCRFRVGGIAAGDVRFWRCGARGGRFVENKDWSLDCHLWRARAVPPPPRSCVRWLWDTLFRWSNEP